MDETQTESVEEVANPAVDVPETEAEAPVIQEESPQEKNWRAVRQKMESLERENRQQKEMLDHVLKAQLAGQQVKQEEQEPDEEPGEYATYQGAERRARKVVQPLEKKVQDLEAKLAEKERMETLNGIRSRFQDFDEIVNQENIAILEKNDPRLAGAIASIQDPYAIALQTYTAIKNLGVVETKVNTQRAKEVEKKLEKNSKAIPSPQQYEKRPMAQAFRMTEDMQRELYEEMTQSARLASSVPELR